MMSPNQRKAAILLIQGIAEALQEAGSRGLPSGHIYAMVMGVVPLESYEAIIEGFVAQGWVQRGDNHMLYWVGPSPSRLCAN